MSRPDRRALCILTLLMLVLTLPFVRRAYFVDDFYFVTMAQGILEHPLRPYDFISDDAGIGNIAWERGQAPRMVNPPLFHYYLAAIIKLFGDAVWKLRTASLIFPLMSLFAVYFLGKRFVKNPLAAACLLAVTPAFWLTSYSLLIDSALLAFFLCALECFIAGHERRNTGLWIASGFLIGAVLLTKYTGFLIYPVLLAWHGFHWKECSVKGTLLVLGISGAIFLLWGLWGIATYGQMHFLATLSRGFHSTTPVGLLCLTTFIAGLFLRWRWPSIRSATIGAWACWGICLYAALHELKAGGMVGTWLQTLYLDKVISVASFLGGTTIFLFFTPLLLLKQNKLIFGAWGIGVLALYGCFVSHYGGFDALQSATLAFFIGATLALLLLMALNVTAQSEPKNLFLSLWLLMGLLELVIVMPWTAGRYLLILLPPVCWFFRLWIEKSARWNLWNIACGATACMGVALAYVDYAQAGVVFPLSRVLQSQEPLFQQMAPRPPHHWYYLADTFDGSQSYIHHLGWENVFPSQRFESGGLFLRSRYRRSSWWNVSDPARFQLLMSWEYHSRLPLRIMDVPASAGFYASCWGSLPYAFTRHPLEQFELYLVR